MTGVKSVIVNLASHNINSTLVREFEWGPGCVGSLQGTPGREYPRFWGRVPIEIANNHSRKIDVSSELQRRLLAGRWPARGLALPRKAVPPQFLEREVDASPKLICSRSISVGENTSAMFTKELVILLGLGPRREQAPPPPRAHDVWRTSMRGRKRLRMTWSRRQR